MRTFFLLLLTAAALVGGFFAFMKMQGNPRTVRGGDGYVPPPLRVESEAARIGSAGPGEKPWTRTFDDEGRLATQFNAVTYKPQGERRVWVEKPVAEFFQYSKGRPGQPERAQKIRVVGESGEVEVHSAPKASTETPSGFEGGSAGPPKRGRLNDVTIEIYPDVTKPLPSIRLRTPNVVFDNETFEIFTAGYTDASGRQLRADEVPVVVTGDYEFRGRGLKMRYNDVDNRLELLEIAHGDYLLVKDTRDFVGGESGTLKSRDERPVAAPGLQAQGNRMWEGEAPAEPSLMRESWLGGSLALPQMPGPQALRDERGEPIQLAGTRVFPGMLAVGAGAPDKPNTSQAKPQTKPAKKPQAPYRAIFRENVRITQGEMNVSEKQLVAADLLMVDFRLGASERKRPTTAPASRPARPEAVVAIENAAKASAPLMGEPDPGAEHAAFANAAQASARLAGDATPSTAPAVALDVADPFVASVPTTAPSTRPTTRPAAEPMIIRWSGLLQIVPLDEPDPTLNVAIPAGEAIVRLLGTTAPVQVTQDLSSVRCAALAYFTGDGSLAVRRSAAFPQIVLTQRPAPAPTTAPTTSTTPTTPGAPHPDTAAKQNEAAPQTQPAKPDVESAILVTESIDYAGTEGVAILSGTSTADVRLAGRDGKPPERVAAAWSKRARVYLDRTRPASMEEFAVRLAMLEGDVAVDHPQLVLNSQALELGFDLPPEPATKPTTRPGRDSRPEPQLRTVVARDAVRCLMKDESGRMQVLNCNQLSLATQTGPDGKLYPSVIHADGEARASDGQQNLAAEHITLELAPAARKPATRPARVADRATTRPSGGLDTADVEVRTVTATGGVRAVSADGGVAVADEMHVRMIDGKPQATLIGKPASVADADGSTVTGPVILVDPSRQAAKVDGAGSLTVIQRKTPEDPGRPVTVAWTRFAELLGERNRVDVVGPVTVTSTDPDGTVNTATGKHVLITMVDKPKPATKPATRPLAKPATRPAREPTFAGADTDFMKDKAVSSITLHDDAVIRSDLRSPAGDVLREFELKSQVVRYELLHPTSADPQGRIVVPGAGTMLVRDHRPMGAEGDGKTPTTAPAAQQPPPAPKSTDVDLSRQRGAVAFKWNKGLVYDERVHTAVLDGDATVAFRSDDPREPLARLDAEQIYAVFEPKPKPATRPSTRPTTRASTRPATKPAGGLLAAGEGAVPLQLKRLSAVGETITITRGDSVVTGNRVEYDPKSQWLGILGTDRNPATYKGTGVVGVISAEQVWFNTLSWKPQFRGTQLRISEPQKK